MATHSVGGGCHDTKVYLGDGNVSAVVYGRADIIAGSGNDSITLHGNGHISVGGGSDTISMTGKGTITETGIGGHDTINLGCGNDTIFEQGQATVYGHFGSATISGGELVVIDHHGKYQLEVLSGSATIIGGDHHHKFVGGHGDSGHNGSGSGRDSSAGGSGHDTAAGGAHGHVFDVLSGHHVITNFVAGQDKLYIEGHSLCYLEHNHDVTSSGGNTFITLDGGATTIELKGVGSITHSDITTHGK